MRMRKFTLTPAFKRMGREMKIRKFAFVQVIRKVIRVSIVCLSCHAALGFSAGDLTKKPSENIILQIKFIGYGADPGDLNEERGVFILSNGFTYLNRGVEVINKAYLEEDELDLLKTSISKANFKTIKKKKKRWHGKGIVFIEDGFVRVFVFYGQNITIFSEKEYEINLSNELFKTINVLVKKYHNFDVVNNK